MIQYVGQLGSMMCRPRCFCLRKPVGLRFRPKDGRRLAVEFSSLLIAGMRLMSGWWFKVLNSAEICPTEDADFHPKLTHVGPTLLILKAGGNLSGAIRSRSPHSTKEREVQELTCLVILE
jgi:hypothetical protein